MAGNQTRAHSAPVEKEDITNMERVISPENGKDFMNYDRVDAEVAKCAVPSLGTIKIVDTYMFQTQLKPASASLLKKARD